MRLLIDTHSWLWWFAEPERLSRRAHDLISDRRNEIIFSAASAWEIAIKYSLGRLLLPEPPAIAIPARLGAQQMTSLPIYQTHVLRASALPMHHRDPFDRVLIAQSQIETIAILTADEQFLPYDVEIAWAGRGRMPRRRR